MTQYIIYFHQQWVGDHSEAWFRERGPLAARLRKDELHVEAEFHRVPVHTNLSLSSKGATPGYRSTEGHRGSHSRLAQRAYADFDTVLNIDSERSCARRLRSVSASAPKV